MRSSLFAGGAARAVLPLVALTLCATPAVANPIPAPLGAGAVARTASPWEDPTNGDVTGEMNDPAVVQSTDMWANHRIPNGSLNRIDGTQPTSTSISRPMQISQTTCEQMGETWGQGACSADVTMVLTETQVTDSAQLLAMQKSRASQTIESSLVLPRRVHCRDWSQKISRGLWSEEHNGRFCYDGAYAWVAPRSGSAGWHICGISSGIGYSVNNIRCDNRNDPSAYSRNAKLQMYDQFRVSFIYKGFPVACTWQAFANAYPSGNIYYHKTFC